MKFALAAVTALVMVTITSSGVLGQAARPAPGDKAGQKRVVRSVNGSIRTASSEAIVVVGRDKGREIEWTFALEPTTNIRKGNKSIVGKDLKVGENVQVRFSERDGKAVAESVIVRAAKTPPAATK